MSLLALERGDADLAELESELGAFNVFEALGMSSYEIRHSNLLAYLLDPENRHGLSNRFATALLQRATKSSGPRIGETSGRSPGWSSKGPRVQREWENIDILLSDDEARLLVVLENKTFSTEHSDQLHRYSETVARVYPTHRRFFLYLTPDGDLPSEPHYVPITYEDVEYDLRTAIEAGRSSVNPDLLSLVEHHYFPLLRREGLVPDDKLEEVAKRVYRKHKSAIDYISRLGLRASPASDIVSAEPRVEVIAGSSARRLKFIAREWEEHRAYLRVGKNRWRLQFQIREENDGLDLVLRLEPAHDEIGKRIVKAFLQAGAPFVLEQSKEDQHRVFLYRRRILPSQLLDDEPLSEEGLGELRRNWDEFLESDFPRASKVVSESKAE